MNMGGFVTRVQRTCPACNGAGVRIPPSAVCRNCRGAGLMQKQREMQIQVPRGCPNQKRFVFKGYADEAPNMETGDVIVEVNEKKHPVFSRLGDTNLLVKQRVSLLDALCGVRFTVKHLDGANFEVTCPEGQVVRPGDVWVVSGQGMPHHSHPSKSGDLIVRFEVEFPAELPT